MLWHSPPLQSLPVQNSNPQPLGYESDSLTIRPRLPRCIINKTTFDLGAYDNHMFLARFFTEPEDKWLKHHFIQLALHSARKFKMDSGKREAEANLHMGQVYLEKGQLERAQEHYEVFYHLTMGRTWQDPSGRMHHSRSCEELQKLFTLLGQRLLQAQDYTHAIKMFNEAYQMAKESGDRGSEGEAAYRLGLAYQSTGDQKTAKQVCSDVCMEISTILKNADSLGRAYEAIAKSLERYKYAKKYSRSFVTLQLNHLGTFLDLERGSYLAVYGRVREPSDFIKNILNCVPKMNEGLTEFSFLGELSL
uniref:Tetratricopeptide repeat protein 29 n=1 Tax=Sinocyclocheilus grahami TaxID=75366 RepID=A0A672QQT5_SINGR